MLETITVLALQFHHSAVPYGNPIEITLQFYVSCLSSTVSLEHKTHSMQHMQHKTVLHHITSNLSIQKWQCRFRLFVATKNPSARFP